MENDVDNTLAPSPVVRRAFPTLPQAALLVIAAMVIAVCAGAGLVVAMLLLRAVSGLPDNPAGVAIVLSYPLSSGAVLVLAVAWSREPLHRLFPMRRAMPLLIAPLFLMLLGLQMLTMFCNDLLFQLLPPPEQAFESLDRLMEVPIGSTVILVLFAPLCEEMLFRGVILQGFARNYRPWSAIVGSAFLFVLVHANPWQVLGPLVLGVALGWCMLRTQALWVCMAGHALWNGTIALASATSLDIPGYTAEFADWPQAVGYIAPSLVLTVGGFAWLTKTLPPSPFPQEAHETSVPDSPLFDKHDAAP